MKKILFLLSAIVLTACHSTYVDKNDYDPETYDYIPETEHEYLGQYSYSGITMAWKDFSDYQLTEKVLFLCTEPPPSHRQQRRTAFKSTIIPTQRYISRRMS